MSAGWKRASSIKAGDVRGCYVVLARVNGKDLRHPRYTVCCTNCANVREVSSSTLSNQGKGCVSCTIVPGQPRKYADRVAQHIPLYQKWVGMRHRCSHDSPDNKPWFGKGIKVCKEWNESFEAFEEWALANGYRDGLTIDRLNTAWGYEPSNCEWVTKSVNSKRARMSWFGYKEHLPIEALWGSC